MPPLYVIQQNAKLHIDNRRLHVDLEGQELASLPLGQVSQVILFGNIGITTPAMVALLAQNCEVIFLSEDGRFRGRLLGEITPHVPLRRAQYARLGEPAFVLEMARGFVASKLLHMRTLLVRHNQELKDTKIQAVIDQLAFNRDKIRVMNSLNELLGLEGASTRAYFSAYRQFFDTDWRFNDRNRRPPSDPINVLLSLTYTLLTQSAMAAVQVTGLDPYGGFLHDYAYNRPGLALDLLEEFRPVADGLVLWCVRSGQLTPGNFSPGPAERSVVLDETGFKRVLRAYEERLDRRFTHPKRGIQLTLRQCMIEQARQVAERILSGQAGYQGMGWK